MSVLASDPFTGTGAGLGANWTQQTGIQAMDRSADTAIPNNLAADCGANYSAITWPDDQYSQAEISVTGTGNQTGIGIAVRMSDSARTFYWMVVCKAASNNVTITRFNAGTPSLLEQRTTTWVDGDIGKIQVSGQATNITIKVFQNGSQLGADISDTSASGLNAGRAGVAYSSTTTAASLNNWEGGSIVSGSSILSANGIFLIPRRVAV